MGNSDFFQHFGGDSTSSDIHLVNTLDISEVFPGSILKGMLDRKDFPIDEKVGLDGLLDEVDSVEIYVYAKTKNNIHIVLRTDEGVSKVGRLEYDEKDKIFIVCIPHNQASGTTDIQDQGTGTIDIKIGIFIPKSIESKFREKIEVSPIQTITSTTTRITYILASLEVPGFTILPDYNGWHEHIKPGAFIVGNLTKDAHKKSVGLRVVKNFGNGRIQIRHGDKPYMLTYDKESSTYLIQNIKGTKDYRGTFTLVDIFPDEIDEEQIYPMDEQ